MANRGCVRIEGLALQILLNDNPGWRGTPVAVTREEKPQSPVLSLNQEARERGLTPGMKYSNALALVPALRARHVAAGRMAEARERIVTTLVSFTPDIEPCPFDEDAIWVSLEGLRSLFSSERRWIERVRRALGSEGFSSIVVAGFTRVGTYVVSRSRQSSIVFSTQEEERAEVATAPVHILPLPLRVKGTLRKLGIHTVRQFLRLPADEIAGRLGREASRVSRSLLAEDLLPIPAAAVKEERPAIRHLDAPVGDQALLMPHVRELLEAEARRAESGVSVICAVALRLRTEDGEIFTELIRPAVPTLRPAVLLRLIELRLAGLRFHSGIEDIRVSSMRTSPSGEQGELFSSRSRDLSAGARAFASIRARYGNNSVTRAQLHDSHLPERSFEWVPMDRLVPPHPRRPDGPGHVLDPDPTMDASRGPEVPFVVRRIRCSPIAGERDTRSDGHQVSSLLVSGSWWGTREQDAPFRRAYFYSHSMRGVVWHFTDQLTGTAWVQGWVD